jgi:hypothetical protein
MSILTARIERLERRYRDEGITRAAAPQAETLARDPAALCARAGFVPDPWQLAFLCSLTQTILVCCSRQAGKSTVIALLIILTLLLPGQTVVIISPSERQSKELMRKVLAFWRKIGRLIPYISVTRTSLELANGSRLEAFPASATTIRGISAVNLLVAEEAALVPDELYNSVSPMLAVSNGRLVAPTTPHGKRGWFFGLWEMSPLEDADIERVKVTADQCPRISAKFLARERRRIGEHWYGQEYRCEFRDTMEQFFSYEEVMAALDDSIEPLLRRTLVHSGDEMDDVLMDMGGLAHVG